MKKSKIYLSAERATPFLDKVLRRDGLLNEDNTKEALTAAHKSGLDVYYRCNPASLTKIACIYGERFC